MEIADNEKEELLSSLSERYGYDFTEYADASIKRRINHFAKTYKVQQFFDLKHDLLNDDSFFARFILDITVNVTEMFRDPSFFSSLTEHVFPVLATYPYRKVWHAGCSTGEEVYSLAIMLKENGLLEKTKQYATDINSFVIEEAREGIYPLQRIREYTRNYIQSGGNADFSSYYTAHFGQAIMNKELKKNMIFSPHNLVTDKSFNEFNLIICRNVLIYFNRNLQEKVFSLFDESLTMFGFLALGNKETLLHAKIRDRYEEVDAKEKIYKKIA